MTVFNGLDEFVAATGEQAAFVTTVETDGSEKPAAVIESIVRYVA